MADWRNRLKRWQDAADADWSDAIGLAKCRLDFVQTNMLDRVIQQKFPAPPPVLRTKPVRLALLGSSTMSHLHAAIRVAGLRRGLWIEVYENEYGQYRQELSDSASGLYGFQPNVILFHLDASHLSAGFGAHLNSAESHARQIQSVEAVRECWQMAKSRFHCPVLHQTALNPFPRLMGNNEQRLAGSRHWALHTVTADIRHYADTDGVDLVDIAAQSGQDGLRAWHDPALWCRSKQEITHLAAPVYGDLVARVLAAQQGLSAKCLVLDLDNTIWGGVIGDDGVEGIVLGQGSPLGEGFAGVQNYAKELAARGVILAVCSKNTESVALDAFARHPEMVLQRHDIACFVANWTDKASNIRHIAQDLKIGLDSLVFVDDNPMERDLVRRELPMVAVPEVPLDPALVPGCLAAAGYFEGITLTDEDRARTKEYHNNHARAELKAGATDMESYLRSLEMKLLWRRFDPVGLPRIVQLINKTNQFNLTTRRFGEAEIQTFMQDPNCVGLQLRLLDRFGDNGMISVIMGRPEGRDLRLETWLMSCRVLGRQVEAATLNLVVAQAKALGFQSLIGEYLPTEKNGMVQNHYAQLGFSLENSNGQSGQRYRLDLETAPTLKTSIDVVEEVMSPS